MYNSDSRGIGGCQVLKFPEWVVPGVQVRAIYDITVPFVGSNTLTICSGELGRVYRVGSDIRVYLGTEWIGEGEPEEPYLYVNHNPFDFLGLWERVGSRTHLLKSVADAFDQLSEETEGLAANTPVFSITFLGEPWEAEPMVWEGGLRHDMFRLAWVKRKIDLSRSLGRSLEAAYDPPIGTRDLVNDFGMPTGVRVTF